MICKSISASSLQTFRECPLKYHVTYELKIRGDTHPSALIGHAVHKVLELMSVSKTVPDIKKICDECKAPMYDEVGTLVKNALKQGYLSNLGSMVGAEHAFKIPFIDDVCINGIIDRLDIDNERNRSTIHDIKTGKIPYTKKELEENYQAMLYNIAVRRKYPDIDEVNVIFWFVRKKERRLCTFVKKQTEGIEEKIKNVYRAIIETEKPKPTKNNFCKWCVYYDKCPLFKKTELTVSL